MTRPPFPAVIDSSLISAARSCGQRVGLEYFHHYKPRSPNVHLHAGKSFARGLEVARQAFYERNAPPTQAVAEGVHALLTEYGDFECPEDSAKSATRMAGALVFYFDMYPLDTDAAKPLILPSGKRAIEYNFLEPLDFTHPETGDPVLYSGRFDMAVDYAGGAFGEDDKTASQLGAQWGRQWELHPQFTAYTWGAGRGGLKLDGFLVRGISILKTKYDRAQEITYRPSWRVERWYEKLVTVDLPRLVMQWEEGKWDLNESHACNEFGGCMFRGQVCSSPKENQITWLDAGFVRRRWDPVLRTETLLEGDAT